MENLVCGGGFGGGYCGCGAGGYQVLHRVREGNSRAGEVLRGVRKAAVNNCPACGAPLTLRPDTAGYECVYCHTVYFPGEEDDGVVVSGEPSDPSLACPVCSLALVNASIAKTPLLYCNQCHGLLLPTAV